MAKRKRAREAATEKPRLEIRFDSDVYGKMQSLAERSGISVNQLVNGVMRWAVANGYAGEAAYDDEAMLHANPQAGCVFFGKMPIRMHEDERDWRSSRGEEPGEWSHKGNVVFSLDFTERRVVKE